MKKLYFLSAILLLLNNAPLTAMFTTKTSDGMIQPRLQLNLSSSYLPDLALENFILDTLLIAYNNLAVIRKIQNPDLKKLGNYNVKTLELSYDPYSPVRALDLYFDTLEDAQRYARTHLQAGKIRHEEHLNPKPAEAIPVEPQSQPTTPSKSPSRSPRTPQVDTPITAFRRSALSPTNYNLPGDQFEASLSRLNIDEN